MFCFNWWVYSRKNYYHYKPQSCKVRLWLGWRCICCTASWCLSDRGRQVTVLYGNISSGSQLWCVSDISCSVAPLPPWTWSCTMMARLGGVACHQYCDLFIAGWNTVETTVLCTRLWSANSSRLTALSSPDCNCSSVVRNDRKSYRTPTLHASLS